MKNLTKISDDDNIKYIFQSPISLIDYDKSDFVDKITELKDETVILDSCSLDILPSLNETDGSFGLKRREIKFPKLYSGYSGLYYVELSNVFVHGYIVFDSNNNFYLDSFRVRYGKDELPKKLHLNDFNSETHLDGNSILIKKGKFSFSKIEEPCLMFYSVPIYGHYLLESITLLWSLRVNNNVKIMLHPKSKPVPKWLLDLCKPFGINADSFVYADQVSLCKKLYIASRPFMLRGYLSDEAKKVWETIRDYYVNKCPELKSKKIYISRKNVNKRRLANEVECEKIFEERGFEIVNPASISVGEQVSLFSGATHIVGPVGSGLHNIVFSSIPDKVKLLILCPYLFPEQGNYALIEGYYGRTGSIFYGKYSDTKGNYRSNDWTVDLLELEKAVDEWLSS